MLVSQRQAACGAAGIQWQALPECNALCSVPEVF